MQTTDLIANQLSVADVDVRDRRLARLTTLLEVASMLSSELDVSEIVRQVLIRAIAAIPACLSSDARCNTPCRFDIGLVVQDLKECCHASLFASVGRRKRPDRDLAGGRALDRRRLPGRLVGRNPPITRELRAERTSLERGYSPLHAAGAYQLRRRREAILEQDSRLTPVRRRSARRRMDARTDLRMVEIWQRTRSAGHRLRDNLRLHLSSRPEGRGSYGVI